MKHPPAGAPARAETASLSTRRQTRGYAGFTLIELLLSMVVGAIVLGGAVFIFANMAQAFGEREDGVGNTLAPAYSQLPAAMQLQAVLAEALQHADAAYVLGGANEVGIPAGADVYPTTLPTSINVVGALANAHPATLTSARSFRAAIAGTWGAGTTLTAGTDAQRQSFSIYVFENKNTMSLTIHCRRADSGALVTYTVDTYLLGDVAPNPGLSYRFSMTNGQAARYGVDVGATHMWLRQDGEWAIDNDLGAQVVFPDPTALPYEVTNGTVATYSRLAMFVPTFP